MSADALVSMAGATMKERAAKWPTDEVSMSTDLCARQRSKAMRNTNEDRGDQSKKCEIGKVGKSEGESAVVSRRLAVGAGPSGVGAAHDLES